MNPTEFSNSIQAAIGFSVVACLWHFGFRQLAIDTYRQELFEIRDRLFDLAAKDKSFGFAHPAYGPLRMQFNGTIRFAHRMNMIQIVIFKTVRQIFGPRVSPIDLDGSLEDKLATVDCATQAEIVALRDQWTKATMRFFAKTSLLFYAVFFSVALRFLIRGLGQYLVKKVGIPKITYRIVSRGLAATVWDDVALTNYSEAVEGDDESRDGNHLGHQTA